MTLSFRLGKIPVRIAPWFFLTTVFINVGLAESDPRKLAQVRALPFAEIKLDRSFVDGVSREPKFAAICEMSVGLAHRFGKRAVAEGIESPADLAALEAMG